jgi:peptidase E
MRKILLTSTGFSNKKFEKLFLEQVDKSAEEITAIFVPTAAIDEDAKMMLPFCMQDLTNAGLLPENILTYNLDYLLRYEEAKLYDAIYFCGGSPEHLLYCINNIGFHQVLNKLVDEGMFYIGVNAGSIVATSNMPNNLGYADCILSVHCQNGSICGGFKNSDTIYLTDKQAIWITGDKAEIIE